MSRVSWNTWHDDYDREGSSLAIRLGIVQDLIRDALAELPEGPIRVVSMCAGQGRDVIEVLPGHPRGGDVVARLVELDAGNVGFARRSAAERGLVNVEVVEGDASVTDAYLGAVPAALVLVCGVFGNMAEGDVAATIARLPEFCAPGAVVVWTRHRRPPDLTPSILRWFEASGFEEITTVSPRGREWVGVGAHRFVGTPRPLVAGERIFTFVRDPADPPL